MLTYSTNGKFKILLSEDALFVRNEDGVSVPLIQAIEDCKVGTDLLSIAQLVWLRQAITRIMIDDHLIEPNEIY